MRPALTEAKKAETLHGVLIGAVVVLEGEMIGKGYNLRETIQDATAHAEILAIKEACEKVRSWCLENASLSVALEPYPICSGAMILFCVAEVHFGAYDPKGGIAGTSMNLLKDERFNHQAYIEDDVLENGCGRVLTDFFRELRQREKKLKKDWSTNER